MDLFGGRERRLQAEIAKQLAVITVMEDQIDRMADLLADSNGRFDALLESNSRVLAAHTSALALLEKKTTVEQAEPAWSPFPLHVPEWEEDAAHQLETGQIDEEKYQAILKEAGLAPNIEVDLS